MTYMPHILIIGLVLVTTSRFLAAGNRPLPGTAALESNDDLSAKMVAGAHRFLDRKLAESIDAVSTVEGQSSC